MKELNHHVYEDKLQIKVMFVLQLWVLNNKIMNEIEE
jgi:hypothetical protein